MKAKQAIQDILAADVPLTAVVGTRIYAERRLVTEGLPCVVFSMSEAEAVRHFTAANGLVRHEFAIESIDTVDTKAWAVADAVRTALEGFSGTIGGTVVQSIAFVGELSDDNYHRDGSEIGTYRAEQIYEMWSER